VRLVIFLISGSAPKKSNVIETDSTPATPKPENWIQFRSPHRTEYSFLEFFAGIGLTHLGLRPQGWKCVYANDIEAKKRRMYESCFGPADYYHVEDIWKTKSILSRIPLQRADLASASFPCVDLSLAGNLKGLDGDQSGAFYGFLKVLTELQRSDLLPRAVLIENVIGFLASHDSRFFRIALKQLSKLGYYVDAFIVDAKHFVPQSRPRLFLIGFSPELVHDGIADRQDTEHSFWARQDANAGFRPARLVRALKETPLRTGWLPFALPALPGENRTLENLIETAENQDWWGQALVGKHLAEMHDRHRDRVEQLKNRRTLTIGTIYRRVREGKSRSEIRTDGLAGCLRTPRGGSSKQIVMVAGKGKVRMRWMSPREYARLQGCPDFPIEVERNEALYGFGDAVCVPVISWIAEKVLARLFPTAERLGQPQQSAAD
jgi:DNA (cytosine-5)-methyltransferase 1